MLFASLALLVGCSSSPPPPPSTPRVDSMYDVNAALSGRPSERTVAVATALQAQLTSAELGTLLDVDWGQEGASRLFRSGRLARAMAVAAEVLVLQPDPPGAASALALAKSRRPISCDPDCEECMDQWNKRLSDFGTQTNTSAWTCGFYAVAGLATGGVAIPGAVVMCAALVSMLYFEFNAYRNDLLLNCSLRKPVLVQKDRASASDLQSFLASCRNRNDGGVPDGGVADGGVADGGTPDGGSCAMTCSAGRSCVRCGGQNWCLVPGSSCCEAGGCQCYMQQQGPGTVCCPSSGPGGQAASSFAWCQYWQGNGSPCIWDQNRTTWDCNN